MKSVSLKTEVYNSTDETEDEDEEGIILGMHSIDAIKPYFF